MNMMKYCPECYKELPPNSDSCPFCGYNSNPSASESLQAPNILKSPPANFYIPPEQTILSLLLLLISFWTVNIAITITPVFLDIGTMTNLLIAGIGSQVLTRALIGAWAMEEASLKKDATTNQKLGAFLLAFLPIAGFFSFLKAARTAIRKERLSNVSIVSISGVLIAAILLYASQDGIAGVITDPTPTPLPTSSAPETEEAVVETAVPPTATPRTYSSGCRNPNSVTAVEEGDIVEVCGKVTNYGDIECETCPLGFYSFIKLDGKFQIVSYDWRFSFAWLGDCMRVSDEVEILGEEPVFQFGKGEGYAGTECITDAQGELVCDGGFYFQDYFGCDP